MIIAKSIGILLIAAGMLGLIDGGFAYTSDAHRANLGSIAVQVKEKEAVYVPILLSGAVIAFGVLLLVGFKRD